MDTISIVLVALRAAALSLSIAGEKRTSDSLYTLSDLVEAGRITDDHMRLVAEKLRERDLTKLDWDDVIARATADSARLHADK